MKIIFLNTWHATLASEIRQYIQESLKTTAVFCFQEADSESRLGYESILTPEFVLYETKRLELDGSWYTNTIYVRQEIPVIDSGGLFLEQPNNLHLGLAGFITVLYQGKPITICNMHGIPQPGDKLDSPARLYQTNMLIETFKNHEAVVIGGDFNLLPEAQSVQLFAQNGYKNLIADYNIQTTRNKITFERYPDSIQYYADFVFTSPTISVKDFVVPEEIISDHQPLELYLTNDLPLRPL